MDATLFEQLLYEEEGPTLDFKRDQYPFAKATEEEKSELLKDILGCVNTWRRAEAYILIGVDEVRGGRATVVGIPSADHLADHSLQQFVNSVTNQPVRFRYEAFGFEGKQVGVIRIEEQPRPVYLKRDYGKLKKNEVYVRRGSSTDPTKPALPDEIAQMGSRLEEQAELVVEFAGADRNEVVGSRWDFEAEHCIMPDKIPLLGEPSRSEPFYATISHAFSSPNYYRRLAKYEFARRLFRPVRLAVTNAGEVAASSVRAEIELVDTATGLRRNLPDAPKRSIDPVDLAVRAEPRGLDRATPGDVHLARDGDKLRINIDCGDLQPGRTVWSERLYVARRTSGELMLSGRILADNLPRPKEFSLTIGCDIKQTSMTVQELKALPEPK